MNYITILHASLQQQTNECNQVRETTSCAASPGYNSRMASRRRMTLRAIAGYPIAAVALCLKSAAKLNVVNGAFRGMQCGIDVPKGAISQAPR